MEPIEYNIVLPGTEAAKLEELAPPFIGCGSPPKRVFGPVSWLRLVQGDRQSPGYQSLTTDKSKRLSSIQQEAFMLYQIARMLSDHYGCTMGQAIAVIKAV